ncbi:hypothetical protein SYNTR_0887 [Candidatus Syntrophocurvum alkaliphilum]|uniref:Competence protein CoiA n=1 Tax=Candidatus Syntrophocurvum alkaliphilum TaxID=2293317 RepID=A0A6I6DGG1_9FIRM|nr:competence protein CoiA family protein [Candidatus Syntrophocurvum alkaliphilum]QGT99480.1 hypothetical protein SYNTR_0887 [Candidatus Syntrophocurvum alkaliphilum]
MFIVQDKYGTRISALDDNVSKLKTMSKNGELFCPECNSSMIFRAGEKKIKHFAHKSECSYLYHEPETLEHQKGKLLIKQHFEKLYPEAQVELEYSIKQTNQRSDIAIIHSNGEIWAVEIQCSKISNQVWLDRHLLYEKAGVKDIWIFGGSMHSYGRTENQNDYEKHKLCSFEKEVYSAYEGIYYLNPDTEIIRILYKKESYYHSDTVIICDEIICEFKDVYIFKDMLITKEKHTKLIELEKEKAKAKEEQLRYEQEQKRKQMEKEKKAKTYIHDIKEERLQATKLMTEKEKKQFKVICNKLRFNENNFPPILHIDTECSDLIATPPYLWQLWIYDNFIYKKISKQEKVWVPKVYEEFKSMVNKGIFRVKYVSRNENRHYSFAIYNFFEHLSEIGVTQQISFYDSKYHRIICDELPIYNDLEDNAILSKALSEYADDESYNSLENFNELLRQKSLKSTKIIEETKNNIKFLPYLVYLIEQKQELVNEWELNFLRNQLKLFQKGKMLTDKQISIVIKIKLRIEKQLNISLDLANYENMHSTSQTLDRFRLY